MAGTTLRRLLEHATRAPGYVAATTPDWVRRELAERIVRETREAAREAMLARHPELLRATAEKRLEATRR